MTKIKEQLFGPGLRGPFHTQTNEAPAGSQWAGFGSVNSGSGFATISTGLVQSGCLIMIQERLPGSLGLAVNTCGHFVVNSIVNGVSFAVAPATGVAALWNRPFQWFLIRTTE